MRSVFYARLPLFFLPVFLSGCLNFFSPLDRPSGDDQLISAARACVDQGDLKCAFDYYSRVSSGNDTKASEIALSVLDRNGASMAAFMAAFGNGDVDAGVAVTRLAASLAGNTSEAHRLSIFGAYQQVPGIHDPALRGLVRFLSAMALMAEILAEDASVAGQYTSADLVRNPTACLAAGAAACFGSTHCSGQLNSKIVSGPASWELDTATLGNLSGKPSFNMINNARDKIKFALTQEVVADAGLGAKTAGFANQLLTPPSGVSGAQYLPLDSGSTIDSPCFRYGLLSNGIGKTE